jgi:hypothetical protein
MATAPSQIAADILYGQMHLERALPFRPEPRPLVFILSFQQAVDSFIGGAYQRRI